MCADVVAAAMVVVLVKGAVEGAEVVEVVGSHIVCCVYSGLSGCAEPPSTIEFQIFSTIFQQTHSN